MEVQWRFIFKHRAYLERNKIREMLNIGTPSAKINDLVMNRFFRP